jgi:hypothetical protein
LADSLFVLLLDFVALFDFDADCFVDGCFLADCLADCLATRLFFGNSVSAFVAADLSSLAICFFFNCFWNF